MKTSIFALLTLILCFAETMAQNSGSPSQSQTQPLTYKEVLKSWDRSRAFGDPRDLKTFAFEANQNTGTNNYSEGLRDNPWLRFHTRSEEIFGDATDLVMIVALAGILFGAYRFLLPQFQRTENDKSRPHGVGGWLLFLCIWLTIIGPLFSFAQLSASAASDIQWNWSVAVILFSLVSGILLWTERPVGWRFANVFFWSTSGAAWLFVFLSSSPEHIAQAIGTSIHGAFWLSYLNKSTRVSNTFLNKHAPELTQPLPTSPLVTVHGSLDAELRALAKLRDDGIISSDEFDRKKQKILDI